MWISVAAIKLKHHYRIPCSSFIPISSCLIADEGEAEAFQKEQIVFSTARDVFFLSLFCYRTKCFGAKEKNRARRPIWLPCLRHTQVLRSTSEWKKRGRRAKGRLRGWRVPGSALLRKTSSGWEARESRYNFSLLFLFYFSSSSSCYSSPGLGCRAEKRPCWRGRVVPLRFCSISCLCSPLDVYPIALPSSPSHCLNATI